MASNIVEYILRLKTGKAEDGLEKVASKTKKATDGFEIMSGAILAVGSAFTVATAGFLSFAQAQSDIINDLNDLSTRSGVAANSIQGLQFAFMASGQEAANVKQLLDKLPRILAMADKGTGNISIAFKKLKISLRDNNDEMKSADEIFGEMVSAIQKIPSATEKATTASMIFGTQAGNLLQAFGNVEDLNTFTQFTNDFGVSAEEGAVQAAQFQQAMAALDVSITALGQSVALIFGETGFVSPIKFAGQVVTFLATAIDESVRGIKNSGETLEIALERISLEGHRAMSEFEKIKLEMTPVIFRSDDFDFRMAAAKSSIEDFGEQLDALDERQFGVDGLWADPLGEGIQAADAFGDRLDALMEKLQQGREGGGIIIPDDPVEIEVKFSAIEGGIDALMDELMGDVSKSMSKSIKEVTKEQDALLKEEKRKRLEKIAIASDVISSLSDPTSAINKVAAFAFDKYLEDLAPIASAAFGLLVDLGQPVINALQSQIDRSISLSTSSMEDIGKAQEEATKKLLALQRGTGTKEAEAASKVARTEQKIQAETLKKELAALKGAPGEDMALAREIALMEQEIQAVAFAQAISQGIQMLPGMLLQVLPSLLFEMVKGLVEAIFGLPLRIWEALKEGFRSIVDALTLGLGDKLESAGNWFKESGQSIKEFIASIGKGQGGLRFTGQESGLAILHPRETVVPESGRMSQSVSRDLAQQTGSPINISINSLVTERGAIDELVRQVEQRFSTFGNSTSPLFN